MAPELRQAVAADLGLSEIVFVDDAERGEVRIFTPAVELDFAGHPSVGTAWMLEGRRCCGPRRASLRSAATARSSTSGPGPSGDRRGTCRARSPDEVEALDGPPGGHDLAMAWAWIDEAAGTSGRGCSRTDRDRRGRGHGLGGDEAVRAPRAPDRHPAGSWLAHPRQARRGGFVEIGGRSVRTPFATTRCPERTARRSCAGSRAPPPRRPRGTRRRPR